MLKGVKENTPEQIEKAEKLFRQYFQTVQVELTYISVEIRIHHRLHEFTQIKIIGNQ